jgi:succinate dehydrogenase/fumarate reductase flavoprotein subunit
VDACRNEKCGALIRGTSIMEQVACDVLVIGGGAAGSRAAYEAKKNRPQARVILAVEGKLGASGSSTLIASESLGINAPFNFIGDGDDPDTFYKDIISTGGGLADPKLCRVIADESCDRLQELIDLGLRFDSKNGRPTQKLLSGCSKARSLTCGGSTGLEIVNVLKKAGEAIGVEIMEGIRIVQLLQDSSGSVRGAFGYYGPDKAILFNAGAVILATGGAGRIFRKNINPPGQEGDGWAMAYQCGAELVNMEFFQIGPAVANEGIKFIIHSHMWRFKPVLTNIDGKLFLRDYCPADVSVDDVLDAKAMSYPFSVRTIAKYLDIAVFKEIVSGRGTVNEGVFFDVTHIGEKNLRLKAPITYERLKNAGIDLATQKIELGLVVQNFNGGIRIDDNGYCGVPGLYAAGEVSGGVHGSDRPGGNNLTDTQVFGYRAGRSAVNYSLQMRREPLEEFRHEFLTNQIPGKREMEITKASSDLFYREMTIVRDGKGLKRVLDFIRGNSSDDLSKSLRNKLLVGEILASAMLAREESRGTHYREDFPETNREWERRISVHRGPDGKLIAQTEGSAYILTI